jgi:hypothetical protein
VKTEDENVILLAATVLLVVHGKDTTGSHVPHSVNVPLEKKSDECLLMGYCGRYPTRSSLPRILRLHRQQAHAARECRFLSDYDAPFQHTSAELSPIWISMLKKTKQNKYLQIWH